MAKPLFIPQKLRPWLEARRRFYLSHAQVQMARELGLNPKKLGRLANHKQQPWKLPLPRFIEQCYYKRFGKEQPDDPRPLEVKIADKAAKKAAHQAKKACADAAPPGAPASLPASSAASVLAGKDVGAPSGTDLVQGAISGSTPERIDCPF